MRVREYLGGYVIDQVTDNKGLNPTNGRGMEKRGGTSQYVWSGRDNS